MYLYIYICIYIYIYVYMYMHLYIYIHIYVEFVFCFVFAGAHLLDGGGASRQHGGSAPGTGALQCRSTLRRVYYFSRVFPSAPAATKKTSLDG